MAVSSWRFALAKSSFAKSSFDRPSNQMPEPRSEKDAAFPPRRMQRLGVMIVIERLTR
jgi:hypothetical protein